jgi:hypothetical protein
MPARAAAIVLLALALTVLPPVAAEAATAQPAAGPPIVEFGECDGPYGSGPAIWVLGIRVICIYP